MLTDEEAQKAIKESIKKSNIHWKLFAIWLFILGLGVGHYFDDWLWFLW